VPRRDPAGRLHCDLARPAHPAPRRRAPATAKRAQGGRLRAQAEGRARRPSVTAP
jgi:hypothetical protein